MQISHLLLSIILISTSSCIEFRPKTKQKAQQSIANRVLAFSKNIIPLSSTEYLSNKSSSNALDIDESFRHGDEVELIFLSYRHSIDSTDIESTTIQSTQVDNGIRQGILIEYFRTYKGIQFSDLILFESFTIELLKNGILIQFTNEQNLKAICTIDQLNTIFENNKFKFSIANNSNCEDLNDLLVNASTFKISVINNMVLNEKIKTINNGIPFTDKKYAANTITQDDLYSNTEISETDIEIQIRFNILMNRYK